MLINLDAVAVFWLDGLQNFSSLAAAISSQNRTDAIKCHIKLNCQNYITQF